MKNPYNAEWVRENVVPYFRGELQGRQLEAFEDLLQRDPRLREEVTREREVLELLEAAREPTTILAVNEFLDEAVRREASDIHLVPGRTAVVASFRIRGRLEEARRLNLEQSRAMIDRLKLMTRRSLERRDLPQLGRLAVKTQDQEFDLRVAILPTVFGERVTIRMHRIDRPVPGLEKMSLSPAVGEALDRLSKLPNGLVLLSGSVGSGKTTLAYALLQSIVARDAGAAIMTLEDPVSYRLEGISQTEIDPSAGYTYAAALRHLFRGCDPDIVFLGELPDRETLDLALHLAQTGHLVFAQIHATSSRAALEQLQETGVSRHQLATALKGIVNQRLVRRVCRDSAREYTPSVEACERLDLPQDDAPYLQAHGCASCNGSGYLGRLPLIEVVEVEDELRAAVQSGRPAAEFWAGLNPEGDRSLLADARLKIRERKTTIEEACHVLRDYPG